MLKPKITDFQGKNGQRIVDYGEGRIYVIKPFKGKKGTTLALKLTKYASGAFGGILAGVLDQIQGGTEVEKLDSVGLIISGVLDGAFQELDDPDFLSFFFDLFSEVYRDNSPIDYDDEFVLEQELPIDLIRHIITYNFRSVFQRLGIAALLKKKVQAE